MLFSWLTGRRYRVAARGRLPETGFPWVAVPSLQAGAFHDAHPATSNALTFAHHVRWVAGRDPAQADEALAQIDAVKALEARYPHCVIFIVTH